MTPEQLIKASSDLERLSKVAIALEKIADVKSEKIACILGVAGDYLIDQAPIYLDKQVAVEA